MKRERFKVLCVSLARYSSILSPTGQIVTNPAGQSTNYNINMLIQSLKSANMAKLKFARKFTLKETFTPYIRPIRSLVTERSTLVRAVSKTKFDCGIQTIGCHYLLQLPSKQKLMHII